MSETCYCSASSSLTRVDILHFPSFFLLKLSVPYVQGSVLLFLTFLTYGKTTEYAEKHIVLDGEEGGGIERHQAH